MGDKKRQDLHSVLTNTTNPTFHYRKQPPVQFVVGIKTFTVWHLTVNRRVVRRCRILTMPAPLAKPYVILFSFSHRWASLTGCAAPSCNSCAGKTVVFHYYDGNCDTTMTTTGDIESRSTTDRWNTVWGCVTETYLPLQVARFLNTSKPMTATAGQLGNFGLLKAFNDCTVCDSILIRVLCSVLSLFAGNFAALQSVG